MMEPLLEADPTKLVELLPRLCKQVMQSLSFSPKLGSDNYRRQLTRKEDCESELILFFRIMVKLCGTQAVRESLGTLETTFSFQGAALTLVHQAVESGFLKLVNEVLIDEVGFEPDFYTPKAKQTLIHTWVWYRSNLELTMMEKDQFVGLTKRCSNLLLTNNDGKSIWNLLNEKRFEYGQEPNKLWIAEVLTL